MNEARIVYSTSTEQAAAGTARAREGIVVQCSWCEGEFRIYVPTAPAGPVVCGRCEDW